MSDTSNHGAYDWTMLHDPDVAAISAPDPEYIEAEREARDRDAWEQAQPAPELRTAYPPSSPDLEPVDLDPETLLAILDQAADGLDDGAQPAPMSYTVATATRPVLSPVRLDAIPDSIPPPLLLDRLDPESHTILFGAGGVGKGTLASSWAVGLVNSGYTVLILDYERHPGEWRRRIGALGDPETLEHIYHVEPTGSLWHGLEAITDAIAATGATVIVIDSIVIACAGSDVTDPGTAGLYAQAVASFGVPVLSLGHQTKAGDTRYPFGSVFWHNLARLTWSLSKEATGIVLACRKSNNYERPPKYVVAVDWYNDRPHDLRESLYTEALADMALELLTDEPMTLAQVVDALNEGRDDDDPAIKSESVRQALKRARALQKCGYRGKGYVR